MPRKLLFWTALLVLALLCAAAGWLFWPTSNTMVRAAKAGDLTTMKWCKRLGVSLEEPERWGWHNGPGDTPLTAAAFAGRDAVITWLIENGVDVNQVDGHHSTAIKKAVNGNRLGACHLLLKAGARPNLVTKREHSTSTDNWTALDWALQGLDYPYPGEDPRVTQQIIVLLRQHSAWENGRGSYDRRNQKSIGNPSHLEETRMQ